MRERALSGDMQAAAALLKAKGGKEWRPDPKTGESGQNVLVLATVDQLAELSAKLEKRRMSALPVTSRPGVVIDIEEDAPLAESVPSEA